MPKVTYCKPGRPLGSIKPKTMMTDALILALNRYSEEVGADGKKRKQLNLVAEALVEKAREGDVRAIEVVFERMDGRVTQAIEASLSLPLSIYVPRDEDDCLTINADTPHQVQ